MIYHVMVISTFSTILLVILSLLNIESELTVPMTSLASLFPSSMRTSVLFGFALPIEVFSIWGTCVTYFGLRIVANMSKKAALISVLLAFVAGVLITGGSMWLQTIINSMNSIG